MIVLVDPVSTGAVLSAALMERGENPLHVYGIHLQEAYARDPHANKWLMSDPLSAAHRLSALPVRAVIAGSEWGVTTANDLAHALGLPHHLDSRARARRDKAAMNYALQEAGLPAARTVYVRYCGDIASALAGFDFPVIVKPVSSAAADGCMICTSPAQVDAAVRGGLGQRNVLGTINPAIVIQDYLDGPQFIVNTVSLGGRHLLSDIHAVHIDNIRQRPVLRHSLLITNLDEQADALVAFTRNCLDAVGVREGAAHTEVRMTRNGPRLIEVNARIMGASQQPALYRAALGYNQADLVAERFTDPDAFANRFTDPYAPAAAMAMTFLNVAVPGTVLASPGLDRVRALPGFHSIEKIPEIGATINEPWLCTGHAGMAYFLHQDREVLASSLRKLHQLEDDGQLHHMRPHTLDWYLGISDDAHLRPPTGAEREAV
jgi:ATP-grasp domain